MSKSDDKGRRVILAFWKLRSKDNFEVYSNLKHFTASYPEYSYNTINNYLSKAKKPFETENLRIERMPVITKPIATKSTFRMVPIVQKRQLHSFDQAKEDLEYWLSRSVKERAAAVTFIISQSLQPGAKLNKAAVSKRKI
ncbi:hypothetical protein [Pseudoflavitalea rhizosphaerae]|uniref:hypothetical protein n=1 Tax=Pseudoflavitalea rhizosphaerae TaxID=1884793 RepID=UPI000F8DF2D4|nr:hypothetical protein [Pseudoflavitalea rhizosphaerae]